MALLKRAFGMGDGLTGVVVGLEVGWEVVGGEGLTG